MCLSPVSLFDTVHVVYLTGSSQYLRASSDTHCVFEGSSLVHFRAYLIYVLYLGDLLQY